MSLAPSIRVLPGHPEFLDLPWVEPLLEWDHQRLVEMPVGLHRHPVRFLAYESGVYVVKELPRRHAKSEFEVLRKLAAFTNRAAKAVGLVERTWLHPHDEQSAVVITEFVRHAFPLRHLLAGAGFGSRRDQMLNAIAGLLVEVHMAGCFWGDCSLSNLLYRFDAGEIEAVMVDAETSELHTQLSDGQRLHDLEIMKENVAGAMADIGAMLGVGLDDADVNLGEDIADRYQRLWKELDAELVISSDESYRIRERVSRLNDLGFSVHDIDLQPVEGGSLVILKTRVGGRTFNSDKLREWTGIDASENQARTILGDLNYSLGRDRMRTEVEQNIGVFRWLTMSFEPLRSRIERVWPGEDPIQGYCDFLNHRMTLATSRRRDVTNEEAFESWVETGFPGFALDVK